MYEILVYLFEHCQQTDLAQDSELVAKKLSAAGFEDTDISEALSWLAGVLRVPHRNFAPIPDSRNTFRAYAPKELAKLNTDCHFKFLKPTVIINCFFCCIRTFCYYLSYVQIYPWNISVLS